MGSSSTPRDRAGDPLLLTPAVPPKVASNSARQHAGWRLSADRLAAICYVAPAAAVFAAFVLGPLGYLVWLSLQQWDGYGTPRYVGLSNYAGLWSDPAFVPELQHSLQWLLGTMIVPVAIGLGLALLLDAVPRRIRSVTQPLLLLSLLLPTAVIAVIWRLLYNPLSGPTAGVLQAAGAGGPGGLGPDWLGDPHLALNALIVAACWASFGLSLLIFSAALRSIAPELIEAARVDGAGSWARFRAITLPGLRSALPLATVATALCAVPSFDLVHILTNGGPGYATTTLALDTYGRAFNNGQVGVAGALAVLQIVVGLVLAGAALLVARGQERMTGDGAASLQRAERRSAARLVAAAALVAATALMIFPIAWLVVLALRDTAQVPGVTVLPALGDEIGTVWSSGFGGAFATSLGIAVVVVAGVLVLAVPAAFRLATSRSRVVQVAGALLLAIGLFQPVTVLVVPLFTILNALALLNTPAGIALPQIARTLPVAVGLLWIALRGVPPELIAAAQLDTAAPRQVLRYIALPLIAPMLAVVAVWSFLSSWNDFLVPLVVLQDESLQTVPLALAQFIGRVDTQYGLLAMGALLSIAPILALYGTLYGVMAHALRRLHHI